MKIKKQDILHKITNELDECLSCHAIINDWKDKVLEVDMDMQTITLKFNFNITKDKEYIGLTCY